MDLLAVSPENEYQGEVDLVIALLEGGLDRYHLRKPDWNRKKTADFIQSLSKGHQSRISIHQGYELANEYEVSLHRKSNRTFLPNARSASLHHWGKNWEEAEGLDYLFLSPLFPSISKKGYSPCRSTEDLAKALAIKIPAKRYALGGITAENVARAIALGFDGVVLHGSLWESENPLKLIQKIREKSLCTGQH